MVCRKCLTEIIPASVGLRRRAVLCPVCMAPVSLLAKVLTSGTLIFCIALPAISLFSIFNTPNPEQTLQGNDIAPFWRELWRVLRSQFDFLTAALILPVAGFVFGLATNFVLFMVMFRFFLNPIGAKYREAPEWVKLSASVLGEKAYRWNEISQYSGNDAEDKHEAPEG